jgi:cytoskeletal protein RodZ
MGFYPGQAAAKGGILANVSIGGTLALARQRAGLTVADVSAQTRIKQALIRAIEQDDYGACGGDFYARGHIRAIARVVGTDPVPLISEYDAGHAGGRTVSMDDLLGRPASPPGPAPAPARGSAPEYGRQPPGYRPPERPRPRRRAWLVLPALLALGVIGLSAYHLSAATGGSPRPAAASPPPATSGAPRPSPAGRGASPTLSPTTAAPVTEVTPVSAAAFGPGGTADGDDPQNASLALSGDPATPWHTAWYATAGFGNLQAGTGLLVDLGRTVTASAVTIRLGGAYGADLQVRAGTSPAGLSVVASESGAGGTVQLPLTSRPSARYLLIWFTKLPPDGAGTYQADISGVTVAAAGG